MTGSAALPRTFRPRWARRVIYPVAVVLVAVLTVGAIVLPGGPAGYGLADRTAVVALGLAVAWFLHRLAAVRIECDQAGLRVVNLLRSRRLEWAEVVAVRLEPAAPWLTLDLSDGTTLPAMGVQGSDGAYARESAARLRKLVLDHTTTTRDD